MSKNLVGHLVIRRWRLVPAFLGLLAYLILAVPGSAVSGPSPERSAVVDPALVQALDAEERVGARILFLTPGGPDPLARESKINPEVDPLVVDLAGALLPGELSLVEYEWVRALRGVVDSRVVERLAAHPRVLSIELDRSVPVADPDALEPAVGAASGCVPSSTKACVQGGRFSIRVGTLFLPGNFAPVAATSSQSAVFYFFNSSNWEIVAKVLNGCAINGRYWVFAAGATSESFVLNIEDTTRGIIVGYSGASCPIADTSFWTC